MIALLLLACSSSAPTLDPELWIRVEGGTFEMGAVTTDPGDGMEGGDTLKRIRAREEPIHTVTVGDFVLMRHEVRIDMYQACVAAGACSPRPKSSNCVTGRNRVLPANCLTWDQAKAVCTHLDGRLPSESEWEYAATSGGKVEPFPWGEEAPDCTRANFAYPDQWSCRNAGLWPVCSHPAGDTPWGFCEMGGNTFEWVEDGFVETYAKHPTDGSAYTEPTEFKVMRGAGTGSDLLPRVRQRTFHPADFYYGGMGVRCAKDLD